MKYQQSASVLEENILLNPIVIIIIILNYLLL